MFVKAQIRVEGNVGTFIDVFDVASGKKIETLDYEFATNAKDRSGVKVQFSKMENMKYLFSENEVHYYEKV